MYNDLYVPDVPSHPIENWDILFAANGIGYRGRLFRKPKGLNLRNYKPEHIRLMLTPIADREFVAQGERGKSVESRVYN